VSPDFRLDVTTTTYGTRDSMRQKRRRTTDNRTATFFEDLEDLDDLEDLNNAAFDD
jgi:hypothetical protein